MKVTLFLRDVAVSHRGGDDEQPTEFLLSLFVFNTPPTDNIYLTHVLVINAQCSVKWSFNYTLVPLPA